MDPALPKLPSLYDVKKRIKAIRQINLQDADIDFLKNRLELFFKGYALSTPVLMPDQVLYRGRIISSKPQKTIEIGYPPANLVKQLGRANRIEQTMFYSSIAREAPFYELKVKPGDFVAVSQWNVLEKLFINNVGYFEKIFDRLGSTREAQQHWQKESQKQSKANQLTHDFIAEEFARDVLPGHEYEYKMSVAISEKLLGNISFDNHFADMPNINKIAGILYPALAMKGNSDNLVLLPDFVDKYLELKKVEYIRIDDVIDNSIYKITLLDFANTFSPDGQIYWKERLPQWRLTERGASLKLSVENGHWVARNDKGEIVEPD